MNLNSGLGSCFCKPPKAYWPFQKLFEGLILVKANFDSRYFNCSDFSRLGVEKHPSIEKAVIKRQAEFLAGRLCARTSLQLLKSTGTSESVTIGVNHDRSPLWPSNIVGSISHSCNEAVAAVGFTKKFSGIGIDVQELVTYSNLEDLILTTKERSVHNSLASEEQALNLTRIFSIKESFFKALYPLINKFFDFQDAEVTILTSDKAKIRLLTELSPRWVKGSHFEAWHYTDETNLNQKVFSLVVIPNDMIKNHVALTT